MTLDLDQAARTALEHQRAGRIDQAITAWRQIISSYPQFVRAYVELGMCHRRRGELTESLAALQQVAAIRPDDPQIAIFVAGALRSLGRVEDAASECRRAIAVNPRSLEPYNRLAELLHALGRLSDVESLYREALQLIGDDQPSLNYNLGWSLFGQGRVAEARVELRRAVELAPDWAHANSRLLFALLHDPDSTPESLFREHLDWARRHADPLASRIVPHVNSQDPSRRVRVGYVSSDFREHSVMHFLEPILANHDRGQFEVFCYSDVPPHEVDDTTRRIRNYADQSLDVVGQSEAQIAQSVRSDGIDILVDLSGHTSARLLRVFAQKPAPVQFAYLGYPATTGLKTIDYRLTDAIADPPGQTERWHTEQLIRLDPVAWCYRPPADAAPVGPAPCSRNGFVTFGSFNMLSKISPQVIELWTKILQAVPNSRLICKAQSFSDAPTRQRIASLFESAGVDASRVQLLPRTDSTIEHLGQYNQIDIALDTFPYNGTTTTCEALWMGVPVLTLAGQTHVSRVGASLLTAIGLQKWIASNADEHLDRAIAFAADPSQLMELRNTMRQRLANSPLRDEAGMTRKIEHAYRNAWQNWCNG